MQDDALHHLPHFGCGKRRDYAPFIYRMKSDLLRRALRGGGRGDNARGDINSIIRHRRDQSHQLQRRYSDLLAHRNSGNGNLRPPADRLGHAARFPRKFYSGLLAESETANIFVEAVFAQTEANLDGADVARFGENVRDRQQSVRTTVVDSHTIEDDRSHLTVENFVWTSDFLLQRTRDGYQLESRTGLVDVADRVVLQLVGRN